MPANKRLVAWKLTYGLARQAHAAHFPGRRFGSDIGMLFVLGAMIATHNEGLVASVSNVAHYVDMPRETTRRMLRELERLGIAARTGDTYAPSGNTDIGYAEKMARFIKETTKGL